jgi:hypothetical protein
MAFPVQTWLIPLATAATALGLGLMAAVRACSRRRRMATEALMLRLAALDERVARLESVLNSPPAPAATPLAPSGARAVRADPPAIGSDVIPGPTLITVPDLSARPRGSRPSSVSPEFSRRFGAVWALADSGAPAEAIARATGHPIGQVELILGLRRQAAPESKGSGRPGAGQP